jgi:hypothetical protein
VSRDLPAGIATAIEAPVVRPALALRIETPDPVYVWTGRGNLEFEDNDGNTRTWLGAGEVGSIDTIGEATDGSATGVRATLFNIPSEFRDDLADQAVRGVLFELYFLAINITFQQIDDKALIWKGRLDDYKITDAGASLSVEVVGESRGIDQRRPAIKRFTHEYQERQHPGDKFFEYVSQMTEISILWAEPAQASWLGYIGDTLRSRSS